MAGNKWPATQFGYKSPEPTYERFETGIIEKLLNTYGFIRCCDRQARVFFHYSQYEGNVEHLKPGDPVEFELSYDKKSGKPIAVEVRKISTEISTNLGSRRVTGIVTAVLNAEGKGGCVAYEVTGECFFIEFSKKNLINPDEKLVLNAKVEFSITDEGSGYSVNEVQLVPSTPTAVQNSLAGTKKTTVKNPPQSFIPNPLSYPGLILPSMLGNGNQMAYGMANQQQQTNQLTACQNGLTFQTHPSMNGNMRTDAEAAASQSQAQFQSAAITKSFKPNPTSSNDILLQLQKQQQQQQPTGSIQHFSGQLTKLLDQQIRHQTAGQVSQNYIGTSPVHHQATTRNNGAQNSRSSQDRNQQEKSKEQEIKRIQGVVCSLKDTYGFIERADMVKEIFFKKTEGYENLALGDDVSFEVINRNNCEFAVNLQLLPANTVVFYDVGNEIFKGTVVQLPNPDEEPSDGRLTYEEDGEQKELAFTDRELAPLCWAMRLGDPVQFQLATDVRDKVVRATNIYYSVSSPNAFSKETRLTGTVTALKDSFGFITATTSDKSEYYFKRYDILDHEVRLDTYVNFTIELLTDVGGTPGRRDQVAVRICKAAPSKKKASRKNAKCPHRGYIAALKEHFGFIEAENREEDLFFRYNVFDGDVNTLKIGDEVEYGILAKTPRPSADCVRAIENGTIPGIKMISDEKFTGKIIRSLRCFNPEQASYCGLIRKKMEDDKNGDSEDKLIDANDEKKEIDSNANNEKQAAEEYEFSVMSLSKPGEVMHKSDVVEFKLAKSKITQKVIAVNVCLIRERKTATVDSVKGQVYYLNFEIDNGKKLSFLATEVKLSTTLSVGDVVEFDYVRGRNNKWSASNVRRVKVKEIAPRPASLVNRYKSMTIAEDGPRVIAIRQPKGPDGSRGFLLQAVSA